MFRVFRSEWYDKKLSKLDKSDQDRISKFEQELKSNPYSVNHLRVNKYFE